MPTTSPRTGTALTARSRRTRIALVGAVRADLRATGAFTADTVAARAGCSSATFYSHFGTKDDALAAGFAATLDELVDGLERHLSADALDTDLRATIHQFVDWQAAFFRIESLVFRTALSRLPEHRPIRDAFRAADRRAIAHLQTVFGDPELAEAFLVAGQGINNPRATDPAATGVRATVADGIVAMLVGRRAATARP